MPLSLSTHLLTQSAAWRLGIVPPVEEYKPEPCDLSGFHCAYVPTREGDMAGFAGGGIGRSLLQAKMSAIGESLERYAASVIQLELQTGRQILSYSPSAKLLTHDVFGLFSEAQYADPNFPFLKPNPDDAEFIEVFPIASDSFKTANSSSSVWAPAELVLLSSNPHKQQIPSTSTGLAFATDANLATVRAIQELLERDALAAIWMNSISAPSLVIPESYKNPVLEKSGFVMAFEWTQSFNPHPVVAVVGQIPKRSQKRFALGVACRSTLQEAFEKAYLEWVQGVMFVGSRFPLPSQIEQVSRFEDHALYYSVYPDHFDKTPLMRGRHEFPEKQIPQEEWIPTASDQLFNLVSTLKQASLPLYSRDLTTPDLRELGGVVVRALCPGLSFLHADERFPFLGGRLSEVRWRYPAVDPNQIGQLNPFPHPLG